MKRMFLDFSFFFVRVLKTIISEANFIYIKFKSEIHEILRCLNKGQRIFKKISIVRNKNPGKGESFEIPRRFVLELFSSDR